jgi:hypothetical protein
MVVVAIECCPERQQPPPPPPTRAPTRSVHAQRSCRVHFFLSTAAPCHATSSSACSVATSRCRRRACCAARLCNQPPAARIPCGRMRRGSPSGSSLQARNASATGGAPPASYAGLDTRRMSRSQFLPFCLIAAPSSPLTSTCAHLRHGGRSLLPAATERDEDRRTIGMLW